MRLTDKLRDIVDKMFMLGFRHAGRPAPEPTMSADEIRQRLRAIESAMLHDGYSQSVDDARCAEWFRLYMMLKRTENAGKTDTKGSC